MAELLLYATPVLCRAALSLPGAPWWRVGLSLLLLLSVRLFRLASSASRLSSSLSRLFVVLAPGRLSKNSCMLFTICPFGKIC